MNLNEVLDRMVYWYMSDISIRLRSEPGIGKTSTVIRAPSIVGPKVGKKLGMVIINGGLLNPQDAIGYLIPKITDDSAESVYTRPFWFNVVGGGRLEDYEGGIIFVDEDDKMDVDTKKVIGEAALSKRLGPHKLSDGWVVWFAGNRREDDSGSTKELRHLTNRIMQVPVTPHLQSLLDWAAEPENNVSTVGQAFIAQNPQIIFPDEQPKDDLPFPSPRSVVRFDQYINLVKRVSGVPDLPDDPCIMEEGSGMIGHAAASAYFAFVRLDREMPKLEEIVKAPLKVKVPQAPDAQMLICYNLAHRVTEQTVAPVIEYVNRLDKDFTVTFASTACKRNFKLVETPAMQKWAVNNSSLMAAIAHHSK